MSGRSAKAFLMCVSLLWGMTHLASCGSDTRLDGPSHAGKLTLSLSTDDRVTSTFGESVATGFSVPPQQISLTLSDVTGSFSHSWSDATGFTQGDYYLAGTYSLCASSGSAKLEGFDRPAFSATTEIVVPDGDDVVADLRLTLDNALLRVDFDPSIARDFESFTLLAHTPGGNFFEITPAESRLLCLKPSDTRLYAEVIMPDGREARLALMTLLSTSAATLYDLHVSSASTPEGVVLEAFCGERTATLSITGELLDRPAPEVSADWNVTDIIQLAEGETYAGPLTAKVASPASLASLILSTASLSLTSEGFPAEVDLLHLTPAQAAVMSDFGVVISSTPSELTVDFSSLTSRLYYIDRPTAVSTLTLVAEGMDGQLSDPATLSIESTPVEIVVESTSPVSMATDYAEIEVTCAATAFSRNVELLVSDGSAGTWTSATPLTVSSVAPGRYRIGFPVGEGSGPIDVKVIYCREERATLTLERFMPSFRIQVDAFATMAAIRIVTSDPSILETVTRRAHIYIDGHEAPAYITHPDQGYITVIGLTPGSSYSFKATMMSGVPDPEFTETVTAVTETPQQLPNSDFEERTDGPSWSGMPSGGRYSRTVVQIFNLQHFTDVSTELPKGWASTNEKTFFSGSSNVNTWYMQPSAFLTRDPVFSQSFAIQLVSTAFDPHGPEIPPYAQTSQPYIDYSPVIPDIACRAAGKLFLGSYSYDARTLTETYNEGIAWSSRPMSLNGYYRFYPSLSNRDDCGLARVSLLGVVGGREVTIASGEARLPLALSYTAFNVPLTYTHFGVKASRIKVMFASSASVGDIAYETANVATAPDPVTATSLGSRLWIDNVTLAY